MQIVSSQSRAYVSSSAPSNKEDLYVVSATVLIGLSLLNYMTWVFGHPPSWLVLGILMMMALAGFGCMVWRRDFILVGVFGYLIVLSLSNPNVGWDPRSLWFFFAKRIFLEGDLYSRLDGYHSSSYPALFSALAASLGHIQGVWGEQIPKLASLLFLAPAFLVIRHITSSAMLTWAWFLLLLLVAGIKLINGYQDPILGLYLVLFLCLAPKVFLSTNKPPDILGHFALLGVMVSMPLLKNEGLAMLIALVLATVIASRRLNIKVIVFGGISIAFWWLTWQQHLSAAGVSDGLMAGGPTGLLQRVSARLMQIEPIWQVGLSMLEKSAGWIAAYAYSRWWMNRTGGVPVLVGSVAVHRVLFWWGFFYSGVLFLIYISTPADLTWHLNTSVGRTMMPLNIALMTMSILNFREPIEKWSLLTARRMRGAD